MNYVVSSLWHLGMRLKVKIHLWHWPKKYIRVEIQQHKIHSAVVWQARWTVQGCAIGNGHQYLSLSMFCGIGQANLHGWRCCCGDVYCNGLIVLIRIQVYIVILDNTVVIITVWWSLVWELTFELLQCYTVCMHGGSYMYSCCQTYIGCVYYCRKVTHFSSIFPAPLGWWLQLYGVVVSCYIIYYIISSGCSWVYVMYVSLHSASLV